MGISPICRHYVNMYTTHSTKSLRLLCHHRYESNPLKTPSSVGHASHSLDFSLHLFRFLVLQVTHPVAAFHFVALYFCQRPSLCVLGVSNLRVSSVSLIPPREASGVRPSSLPFDMRRLFCQTEKTGGLSPSISIKYLTALYLYHRLSVMQRVHVCVAAPFSLSSDRAKVGLPSWAVMLFIYPPSSPSPRDREHSGHLIWTQICK